MGLDVRAQEVRVNNVKSQEVIDKEVSRTGGKGVRR